MEYIVKVLRTLFYNIDRVVYEGIGKVYDLLLVIARTTILDEQYISEFAKRIYVLIGVFMLYKISLSLITYILNPDEFVDKEKGFASILKRVVLSLVMLVLVPYGFRELYSLQAILLEDNTLASFVFGAAESSQSSTYQIDTAGEKIKFILMFTFFQPNYMGLYESTGNVELNACAIPYEYKEGGDDAGQIEEKDGVFVLNKECFGTRPDNEEKYPEKDEAGAGAYADVWTDQDLYQTYAQGIARQNFYLMFKHDIAMMTKDDEDGLYVVDYMAPLSTAVGVAVLWVLLMFCIDVAIRSVKLAFYQLIAPIPILSYIDPKSGKDGMFSKWIKQVGTTYISLFMRLLAVYLAIHIISGVTRSGITDVITGERVTDLWVQIFVIVGVLMFAKQLPKVLEEALGIKGTGDFTLNPMKRLEALPGGKALTKPIQAVGRAATIGVGTAAGVGLAGVLSGQGLRGGAMGRAVLGAARGEKFGKNFASSYGAGRARKKQLDQMKADGVSSLQVASEKLHNAFHGETRAEHVQHAIDTAKAIQSRYESYEKAATGVDEYAKFADKQAKAAAARGDFVAQQAWEGVRDDRIKDIHKNKGMVSNWKHVSEDDFFGRDPNTKEIDYNHKHENGIKIKADTEATNAALANLAQSMDSLANVFNEKYSTVDGYTVIEAGKDPKTMKNQALGAQQSIETNATNTTISDVAKYAGGSKK